MLAVCLGLGLLVDRAAGRSLSPLLLLPVGGAGLVCVTQVTTTSPTTAGWTVAVVLVSTVLGFALGWRRVRELRSIGWAAGAAALVFLVAGAPVLATGTPTFAGYTVLGDTAVHLTGAQELLRHGRDADALEPSNYAVTFRNYYVTNAYPAGGPTALGALSRIVRGEPMWLFHPFLAVWLALLTLAVVALVEPVLRSARRAALVGLIAAQPALLLSFVMQGSLKEVAVTALLATLAALIPRAAAVDAGWREAVPLAVAAAAAVGVLGPSAAVWAAPLLAGWVVLALVAGRSVRSLGVAVGVMAVAGLALVSQTLSLLDTATAVATSVATAGEAGNLLRPLDLDQALGVWLTGDYRVAPTGVLLVGTRVVEALVVLAGAFGIAWCVSRRAWVPLLYVGTMVAGAVFVVVRGSMWADAKALAIVTPAVLVLAMLGMMGHFERHRVVAGGGVALLLLGVVVSNALIYRSASVAPYERLEELRAINEEFAGEGPTLFAEFDDFGSYLLRDMQPEMGALLLRGAGTASSQDAAADVDAMTLLEVDRFPTVVTRTGPIGSRPSSAYRSTDTTERYTVWRRREGPVGIAERVPLGATPRSPLEKLSCGEARALARVAQRYGGGFVIASSPLPVVVNPARDDRSTGWRQDPDDPQLTLPSGSGTATATVQIPAAGRYEVWLEGSIGRETQVAIDGDSTGSVRNRLSGRKVAERLATVQLRRGAHTVSVRRTGGGAAPGAGGLFRPLGPVYLVAVGHSELRNVAASAWRELCEGPLDWVEVVT